MTDQKEGHRSWEGMIKKHFPEKAIPRYERTKYPAIFKYVGKNGVKFGCDYYVGGRQKREMVGTLQEAREKLEEIHGKIRKGEFVINRKKYSFDDLRTKYEEVYKGQPYFTNSRQYYLKILQGYFGGMKLYQINAYDIEQFKVKRKATLTQHAKERSGVSVNREMETLRHMFNKAVEWQMLERNPFDRFKNKGSIFFQENGGRTRFLSQDEIQSLLEVCPEYLAHIVRAALLCGLRKSDLLGLRWENVNLQTGVLEFAEGKKGGRKVSKALCSDMLALLHRIPAKNDGFIFHGPNGEAPLKDISRSFQTALRKAKLKDVRFHDLRRTFASHLAMRGVSLRVIQQELGHSSILMTEIYSRLSPEHQRLEVERLNGLCPEASA